MNPPSAWAVAKRDNIKVAEQCWTHDMPRGSAGRFVGQLPFFYGMWSFSQNKPAAKDLLQFLSEKEQSRQLVEASVGYDLPSFKSYYDFDTWKKVEPPHGTVYNYPPRGDEQPSITGYPARPEVARRSTINRSTPSWSPSSARATSHRQSGQMGGASSKASCGPEQRIGTRLGAAQWSRGRSCAVTDCDDTANMREEQHG